MPETCRVSWQNKILDTWCILLVIYTKIITVHRHLNIKYSYSIDIVLTFLPSIWSEGIVNHSGQALECMPILCLLQVVLCYDQHLGCVCCHLLCCVCICSWCNRRTGALPGLWIGKWISECVLEILPFIRNSLQSEWIPVCQSSVQSVIWYRHPTCCLDLHEICCRSSLQKVIEHCKFHYSFVIDNFTCLQNIN